MNRLLHEWVPVDEPKVIVVEAREDVKYVEEINKEMGMTNAKSLGE